MLLLCRILSQHQEWPRIQILGVSVFGFVARGLGEAAGGYRRLEVEEREMVVQVLSGPAIDVVVAAMMTFPDEVSQPQTLNPNAVVAPLMKFADEVSGRGRERQGGRTVGEGGGSESPNPKTPIICRSPC